MPPKPDLVFNTAPTNVETDHLAFTVKLSPTKPAQDMSLTNRPSAPIIEDWVFDFKDESETKASQIVPSFVQSTEQVTSPRHFVKHVKTSIPVATPKPASLKPTSPGKRRNRKACFVCKSFDHLIKDCDYHATNMAQPITRNHAHRGNHKQYASLTRQRPKKQMVLAAILTQSKPISITAVRPVSADVPKFKVTQLRHAAPIVTQTKSPIIRHITRSPSLKGKWEWRPKCPVLDHVFRNTSASMTLKRFDYNDALGRSKSLNGGYVAFGGNPKGDKISGKRVNQDGLHMDLFGPTFVKILNKKSYFLVVTYDYSRFTWVFFLATKDETSPILKTFTTGLENQLSLNVKVIRSDNGTEFKNNDLNQFCRMKGIKREFSVEVVNTACYVHNRVLVTKPHNKTPYELLHGKTPSIAFMRPFGCPVTILNTLDSLGKFDGKVDKGFLVGYSFSSSHPTWLFDIDSLTKTMNYQPINVGNQTNPGVGFQDIFDAKKAREEIDQQYVLFIVWTSGSTNPQNTDGDAAFNEKKPESEVNVSQSSSAQSKKQDDKIKKEAKGKSPVESFTRYRDLNAEFEDYSDNSINEDNATEADFNNFETTITVSPIPTTRVHKYHPVTQIIGDLSLTTQTRSMTRVVKDQGFEDPDHPDKVYKVVKALYDLHQALRAWQKGNILLVQIYVDDIIFGATNKDLCKYFEKLMKDKFQMSIMGELTFFLGLQVKQKKDGIFISQDKYVAEILRKFGLTEGKSASTPTDTEKPLLKDPDGKDVDMHTYRLMIGSLMYLTLSRPDIMFVVCACEALRLDDEEGVDCLPNKEIFVELARIGYEKPSTKLTFYKAFFSSQWKFLIHTILQCMSAKRTSWNKFSSSMASAVICLSLGDLSTHTTKYTSPAMTHKVFANMQRACKGFFGVETPLFEGMLVAQEVRDEGADEVPAAADNDEGAAERVVSAAHDVVPTVDTEPSIPSPTPPMPPPQPSQDIPSTSQPLQGELSHLEMDKIAQALEITKLKRRVKKLERGNKMRMDMDQDAKVGLEENKEIAIDVATDVVQDDKDTGSAQDQGKTVESQAEIYKINMDYANKVLSMQEDETEPAKVQKVVEVVTTAKLIYEVNATSDPITTASTTIPAAAAQVFAALVRVTVDPRRSTKGVVIKGTEESSPSIIIPTKTKSKDKGKGILKFPLMIYVLSLRLSLTQMWPSYKRQEIEEEESRVLKRINKTLAERAAKKEKLDEEVEELKRHLHIVPNEDDDVYTEATPLA
uniref:Uncharacterized mitochondrial protein AtMg00810-like n=1 Tax=Tanacetum cinerariifolium TaxID=118510 RepID=A0A699HBX5_TANCI|nr:uncharacterized mitochondrial protein AtMg00810-like [Tanacetum cinerariifolium]